MFNQPLEFEIWPEEKLRKAIEEAYPRNGNATTREIQTPFQLVEKEKKIHSELNPRQLEDRSVIPLVNRFISDAIYMNASDIHVESYDQQFRIRLRVDGKLIEHNQPEVDQRQAIVSRLKIMANLDNCRKASPSGWAYSHG